MYIYTIIYILFYIWLNYHLENYLLNKIALIPDDMAC